MENLVVVVLIVSTAIIAAFSVWNILEKLLNGLYNWIRR